MISALSYSGWEWLMLLQHHALALGPPHQSSPGPRFVMVGFTGRSWGMVELITGWGFHCFIQSFIMIQTTRNGEINQGSLNERTGTMCMCVFVCVCEEASLLLATYWFAPPEEELVSRQGEVAGFPALDELPADLLLLQLPLDQRLPLLVHN